MAKTCVSYSYAQISAVYEGNIVTLVAAHILDIVYYGQMIFEMASGDGSSRVKPWGVSEFVAAMLLV